MRLNLFTELIDVLGKVAGGLKAIINLPKAEWETMRQTLDETYRLIDTTLNMMIIRLAEILLQEVDNDFLREAARLDNYNEWMQAERGGHLCRNARNEDAGRQTGHRYRCNCLECREPMKGCHAQKIFRRIGESQHREASRKSNKVASVAHMCRVASIGW